MPCVESLVVWRRDGEGMYLIVDEAKRLHIAKVFPECRIDLVRVQSIPLNNWKGESEDEEEVDAAEKSEREVCF